MWLSVPSSEPDRQQGDLTTARLPGHACRPRSLSGTGQLWKMPLTVPFGTRAVTEVMQRVFLLTAQGRVLFVCILRCH